MVCHGDARAGKDTPQWDGVQDTSIAAWYNHSYTSSMKTAISIADKLFREADAAAKQLGISRSELYATALSEYLARRNAREITARLDQVYSSADGRLDASVAASQARHGARVDQW